MCCCCSSVPRRGVAAADDVKVTVIPPNTTPANVRTPAITVSFASKAVGHLFISGQPIDIVANITNPGAAQQATVTTCISNGLGIIATLKNTPIQLPEKGQADFQVFPSDQSARLPNGAYTLEISVMAEHGLGYGATQLNIWKGPANTTSELFGISYNGPLNTTRMLNDLDLFHLDRHRMAPFSPCKAGCRKAMRTPRKLHFIIPLSRKRANGGCH